jgi:PhnB protein
LRWERLRLFGATVLYEAAMPHGDGLHAHLQIGQDDDHDHGRAAARTVDAGGKPMLPICDTFYRDRMGWVADPFGHIWAISTVRDEVTPEQVFERRTAAYKRS